MSPRGAHKDYSVQVEFKDKRSFVSTDGFDYLYGKDWIQRKYELYKRCRGECELRASPKCWGWFTFKRMHPHHLAKGRVGRHDCLSNLKAACLPCHRAAHPEKQVRWSEVTT